MSLDPKAMLPPAQTRRQAGGASEEAAAASGENASTTYERCGVPSREGVEVIGIANYAVSEDGSAVSLLLESRRDGPIQLSIPTAYLDGLMSVLRDVRTSALQSHQPDKTVLSFRNLQRWAVAAYPGEASVLLVLDGDTPLETSYALAPATAKELADALDKTSDNVRLGKPRADH